MDKTHFRLTSIGAFLVLSALLGACNIPSQVATAPTASSTSGVGITLPPQSAISGRVWHDLCAQVAEGEPPPEVTPEGCVAASDGRLRANGVFEPNEPGIAGVQVTLGSGPCPSSGLASVSTGPDGVYVISSLSGGTYCVTVDPSQPPNASVLLPGQWTVPASGEASGAVSVTVTLADGEFRPEVNFGWDYQFLPTTSSVATETSTPGVVAPGETPSPTPSLGATPSATVVGPTATSAPAGDDPRAGLGNPAFRDTFSNGSNWALYEDDHVGFEVKDGNLVMTAFNADYWEGWMLSWPQVKDFYLEATMTPKSCGGGDRYGIMARSDKNADDVWVGYLFGFTCDGRYSLRTWDGDEYATIVGWTASERIETGSNQTNRIGLKAEGNRLALYANGELITEVTDNKYQDGKFGVYIGAAKSEDFTVNVSEYAYWNLP